MTRQIEGLSHLLLQVSDIQAAEHFYCDLLGLEIKTRDTFGHGRPLIVTQQGLGITIYPPATPKSARAENKNLEHVAFWVTDLHHLIETLRDAGISVEEPRHTGYGRSIYVLDPDGNRVECIERD